MRTLRVAFAVFAMAALGTTSHAIASSPMACHGNIHSTYNCTYSGSRVWTKAPGVTFTQRVQVDAKIIITGIAKSN
jgi:hypothetical protein